MLVPSFHKSNNTLAFRSRTSAHIEDKDWEHIGQSGFTYWSKTVRWGSQTRAHMKDKDWEHIGQLALLIGGVRLNCFQSVLVSGSIIGFFQPLLCFQYLYENLNDFLIRYLLSYS